MFFNNLAVVYGDDFASYTSRLAEVREVLNGDQIKYQEMEDDLKIVKAH